MSVSENKILKTVTKIVETEEDGSLNVSSSENEKLEVSLDFEKQEIKISRNKLNEFRREYLDKLSKVEKEIDDLHYEISDYKNMIEYNYKPILVELFFSSNKKDQYLDSIKLNVVNYEKELKEKFESMLSCFCMEEVQNKIRLINSIKNKISFYKSFLNC